MINFDSKISNTIAQIYHYSQGISEVEFKDTCINLISSLIHFDSATWKESSSYSKEPYVFLHNVSKDFKLYEHELSKFLKQKNYCKKETICFPNSEPEQHEFYLTTLYKQLNFYNIEHLLKYSTREKLDATSHELSLYRVESQYFYNSKDLKILELLGPHLLQAHKLNKIYNMKNSNVGSFIYRVICDSKFNILEADNAVYEILQNISDYTQSTKKLPIEKLQTTELIELKVELHNELYYIEMYCPSEEFDSLTPKEKEIVELVSRKFSNNEISNQLSISPKTLNNHFNKIYMKFQAKSKTEVISKLSHPPTVNL